MNRRVSGEAGTERIVDRAGVAVRGAAWDAAEPRATGWLGGKRRPARWRVSSFKNERRQPGARRL